MIAEICELHRNNTRDFEGYEYDREKFVLDSPAFLKYLDDFHVKDKYLKKKTCSTRQVLDHEGNVIGKADYYFNGWVQIFQGDGSMANEMCSIVIEYIDEDKQSEYF